MFWNIWWAHYNLKGPYKWKREACVAETGRERLAWLLPTLKIEGVGNARNSGGPYKLEKQWILLQSLWKECSPPDNMILAS